MIRTLRALFLARLLREKLLLVAFAVLGVAMWFSGFSKRAGAFWREQRSTTTALAEQKQWLNNRVSIDESAQKAAGRLDAAQTLDPLRLYAEVDKLAAAAGLASRNLGEQRDVIGEQFSIHSLQVTVNKAEWEPLKKFYLSVQARSPYISIEQFALQAPPAGSPLTAILRVSSVEVLR
ncbi:MAG: hypothetical protein H7343_00775 [Undibacterium sp.]|nr:hypothetical protein [Opitutaceae bacterium]